MSSLALALAFIVALVLPTTLAVTTCTSGICCQCTCCSGNLCSPSNVGSVPVQSCSSCTDSVCNVNFPTSCPAQGPSAPPGTNSASCTSGSGSGGGTVWSGTYVLNNACSTAQCCCFTGTFTLTQSGTTLQGTVGLSGQCGGSTSTPFTATLSSPTATSFSVQMVNGQTLNVVKNGVTVTITNTAASQCSSAATCTSGDCLTSGSSTCFHASTRVSYKGGAPQGLADFQHHKECHVPHVVRSSNGVKIDTSCSTTALRVTGDHLIYSARGLLPASSLRKGDVLYADLEQSHPCTITRVTHEGKEEEYFGLNCLESDVIANGLKASTFGSYHWIPATWMKYVSKVVGIERASRWGDSLAALLSKVKLL